MLHREWFCVGRLSSLRARRRRPASGWPSSTWPARACWSPATTDGRAARVLQRLPAPRLAGRAGRPRQRRAPEPCARGVAALPVPLVDLRPGRAAAARAAHRGRRGLRPGAFGLHAVAVGPWGGFLFVHLTPAERRPSAVESLGAATGAVARYPLDALVVGAPADLRRPRQLQGRAGELQRVLPLRRRAPRAGPAGAGVRPRRQRPRLGGRDPAPRGCLDLHRVGHLGPARRSRVWTTTSGCGTRASWSTRT